MYQRLIEAGHRYKFLNIQYRMHLELLKVPNRLFYENKIQNGYKSIEGKQFLSAMSPFLFIDVKDGQEQIKGTSFINEREIDVLEDFTKLILKKFQEDEEQKFHSVDIDIITPYNAQRHAIAERLERYEMDE